VPPIGLSLTLTTLHEVLMDVVGFFNRPQNDAGLRREAGVSLDRAISFGWCCSSAVDRSG
jgi:hypothetical protein